MPAALLTLLAAKAKATALVAATAGVTAAAVGGGTLAMQSVNDSSAISDDVAVTASPEPEAEVGAEPVEDPTPAVDEVATDDVTDVDVTDDDVTDDDETDVDDGADANPLEEVPAILGFTCDPSKNHGQNVSAYARSLPKGPGRGALVSQAAKSDCGKNKAEAEAAAPEGEAEVEAPEGAESPESGVAESEEAEAPEAAEPEESEQEQSKVAPQGGTKGKKDANTTKSKPAKGEQPAKPAKPAKGEPSAKGKTG